jgi:hypothetical protein
MRLAISGTACQGKSTLVNDFLKNWPNYKRSEESYRKILKKDNLKINKHVDQESQWKILNCLIDDIQKTDKTDNIIFDRCPLDNLIYSLWAEEKNSSDIDKKFIDKCIPLVQESMKAIDIIFFIPITKAAPVRVELKENREIDEAYIKEIDNIFKAISYNLMSKGVCPFMTKEDRPPMIEVFGTPEERIEIIKLYISKDGNVIDNDSSVLNSENLNQMETLLRAQKRALYDEQDEQKLKNQIIRGIK